ncbi:carboxymuconolactone decarboxylase family protein [Microbacterium sp. RD1]|uniref:carboxymuconolactone decarboxylase family protein n=1 Tax=Microbacterium sp. RD1 TaxID=3457313 RepID=UPI003FA5A5AF
MDAEEHVALRAEAYPRVAPAELDDGARALRDRILSGVRASSDAQFPLEAADGTLEGPFGVFLFSPSIGDPLEALGARLRATSTLSARQRELATLAVAAQLHSEFELHAHVPLAHAAGISAEEIERVRAGHELPAPDERVLVAFCRANAAEPAPAAEFAALRSHFDRAAVFEILALVLYYRGLASMLELFAIRPPST